MKKSQQKKNEKNSNKKNRKNLIVIREAKVNEEETFQIML